jgi:hypothetical protein
MIIFFIYKINRLQNINEINFFKLLNLFIFNKKIAILINLIKNLFIKF